MPRMKFVGKKGYCEALGDAQLDLLAFLCCCITFLGVVRIPGFFIALANKSKLNSKSFRVEMYYQALMTVLDWLVLPFVLLLILFPWRIPIVYREWKQRTNSWFRFTRSLTVRKEVFIQVGNGILDVPAFIMCGITIVFSPWRISILFNDLKGKTLYHKRGVMWEQFMMTLLDWLMILCAAVVIVTVVRAFTMLKILVESGKGSDRRWTVAQSFGMVLLDFLIIIPLLTLLITGYRTRKLFRKCILSGRTKCWAFGTDRDTLHEPTAHWYVLQRYCYFIRDIPFIIMGAITTILLWRSYFLWRDLTVGAKNTTGTPSDRSRYRRRQALYHFGMLFVDVLDIPFVLISMVIIVTVWRARPLLKGVLDRSLDRCTKRKHVLWMALMWLWDIPTAFALVLVTITVYRARQMFADLRLLWSKNSSTPSVTITVADDDEDDEENPVPQLGGGVGGIAPTTSAQNTNFDDKTWHMVVWVHFGRVLFDLPFPLLALLTLWRLPLLLLSLIHISEPTRPY
eukprot:TRINITY_DN6655_c0_g1_i2.p1 TRINITY_DN6655_c0_g1~~TRINITY_DN6655_c0_g1_i2.p1  ORF type:complete len:512 (+),score=35.26 TRINITY_DN6655_c0_g1_i2:276-1811(+)